MPHTKSAIKRLKQSELRRKRNRIVLKGLKATNKATHAAIAGGDAKAAGDALKLSQKKLDQAAGKGYIHPNKAARLKSRLVKRSRAAAAK